MDKETKDVVVLAIFFSPILVGLLILFLFGLHDIIKSLLETLNTIIKDEK